MLEAKPCVVLGYVFRFLGCSVVCQGQDQVVLEEPEKAVDLSNIDKEEEEEDARETR